MATEPIHKPNAETVDVTGLPQPLVRDIQRLVVTLRERVTNDELSRRGAQPVVEAANRRDEGVPMFLSRPRPSLEEMERLLDEFSSILTGQVLPPDFSRADIYDDHD